MTTHTLKIPSSHWDAIQSGKKTYVVKQDPDDFKIDDIVMLERLPPEDLAGAEVILCRRITNIQGGTEQGYVVLSLEPIYRSPWGYP